MCIWVLTNCDYYLGLSLLIGILLSIGVVHMHKTKKSLIWIGVSLDSYSFYWNFDEFNCFIRCWCTWFLYIFLCVPRGYLCFAILKLTLLVEFHLVVASLEHQRYVKPFSLQVYRTCVVLIYLIWFLFLYAPTHSFNLLVFDAKGGEV